MSFPASNLTAVRQTVPLVHNITNYVVMNFTANALLAVGASPVMSHTVEEVADMVALAHVLVVNIGTLSPPWVEGMALAMKKAAELGKPVVLDPVGAGATPYRNQVLARLLTDFPPTLIRGNASEIRALAGLEGQTKGVDSTESSLNSLDAARLLHERYGCVVSVSGEVDIVVGPQQIAYLRNGHPVMSRVTGMGCSASALAGAFCAIAPSGFEAAVSAAALMGVCGDLAAEKSDLPGSFQIAFLDALAYLMPEDLEKKAHISYTNF